MKRSPVRAPVHVVVHIGRVVVHESEGFAADAFRERLQREIGERIARGAGAADIARQLQAGGAMRTRAAPPASSTPERSVAAELAGRLFR